ncbi:MAG: hypothetical protein KJZ80_15065, partial [Hyphomicrobiaceae bacterium]|nr:hypothetical protein [Hyphomicrobiaceae bacterium]
MSEDETRPVEDRAEVQQIAKAAGEVASLIVRAAAERAASMERLMSPEVRAALPAIARLVDNGGLDQLQQLAQLSGAVEDALSDDIVARLADSASEGLDLIDQLNRSGLKRALPVLTRLVDNGDLERVAQLARVYGAAEDAISDDVVARLADS